MASDDDAQKPDAARGRFKVTEELESWAGEREARRKLQEAAKDRYVTDARPRSRDDAEMSMMREVELLRPVSLRPHDFTLEPTGFRLGIGVSQMIFPHQELVEVAATDPWPGFEVEWKHVGGRSRRRFQPRFAEDREPFATSVEALLTRLLDRLPHLVERGWLAEPVVEWEVVTGFPDEDEPEPEKRAGYRLSARERPREEIVARRGASTGVETMLDWLASTPDYPFRAHPREVAVTESRLYVRRRDGSVARVPLSALRKVRKNRDGDATLVFGRHTLLLLPHREGCELARALEARATVEHM